jgi:hypothetical protein
MLGDGELNYTRRTGNTKSNEVQEIASCIFRLSISSADIYLILFMTLFHILFNDASNLPSTSYYAYMSTVSLRF